MPPFVVFINDREYLCKEKEDIFRALTRSVLVKVPQGCRNGGCGLCKMRIIAGEVMFLGPQSARHVTAVDVSQGIVLGCKSTPLSDLRIEIVGQLKKYLA